VSRGFSAVAKLHLLWCVKLHNFRSTLHTHEGSFCKHVLISVLIRQHCRR